MPKPARDPLAVAILLFSLMLVALLLFLVTVVVRKRTPVKSVVPFIPPGWTNPTSPPPSAN